MTLVLQHKGNTCIVTDLDSFQRFQHLAPPWLYLTHYDDLAESKDIVLMRGDVDLAKLTQVEAKVVSSFMHTFYLHDEKYKLVHQFNKHPREFNFDALVADLQIMKKKRDKDDEVAERDEWLNDEIHRKDMYDKAAAEYDKGDSMPWNPPLGPDGEPVDKKLRDKYRELWKM